MQIKLCGKQYQAKFNLSAMRKFKSSRDKCLYSLVFRYLVAYDSLDKITALGFAQLTQLVDFDDALEAFYAVISEVETIDKAEIEDAMLRVGFLPCTDEDSEWKEPYLQVFAQLCADINKQLKEAPKPKK